MKIYSQSRLSYLRPDPVNLRKNDVRQQCRDLLTIYCPIERNCMSQPRRAFPSMSPFSPFHTNLKFLCLDTSQVSLVGLAVESIFLTPGTMVAFAQYSGGLLDSKQICSEIQSMPPATRQKTLGHFGFPHP